MTSDYDPLTGKGSVSVERNHLFVDGFIINDMELPIDMFNDELVRQIDQYGVKKLFKNNGISRPSQKQIGDLEKEFWRIRFKYDFEFWAYTCIKISAKSKGMDIQFKLNAAQRKYLKALEELRRSDRPIDIILLKARQWGGSTLTQLYMLWIQLVHKQNWNSVICGDVESQSSIVVGMLSKAIKYYPRWAYDGEIIETRPFERSAKTRKIDYSNCVYSVGSAQKPENLRSQDISMAHLTEVGLWRETKGKKPEDLVQSLFGSINSVPYTMKVLESTAKGVGNYFHRTWLDAVGGKNNFTPVFVSWFEIEWDSEPVEDYAKFIKSLTDYEKWLFSIGATLEGINWYRSKKKEFNDEWRLRSECPSTPDEAFQSTGHPFYPIKDVENLRKYVREPDYIGEMMADDTHTEKALSNLRFHEQENGCLKVWSLPDDEPMRDRYVVVMDVSKGISINADNGVICVFDRYFMKDPDGVPEVVAEWCGHVPLRFLVWKGVQIASFYKNALLVIESNTPETSGQSGFEMEAVFDEIAEYYDNLYAREPSPEQIRLGRTKMWGFHTNRKTKTNICSFNQVVLADDGYIEPCKEAVDEYRTFEVKPNGSLGAVDGCHDDRHITRAIGNWICYQHLEPPVLLSDMKSDKSRLTRRVVGEATI